MLTLTRILEHARERPTRTALVHDGVALDYAGFAHRIAATRQHLALQGLPAAGVVVIAAAHRLDDWILLFALRSLGLSTVVARSAVEIDKLELPDIACVIASGADDREPALRPGPELRWRWLQAPRSALDGLAAPAPWEGPWQSAAPGAGHILCTSGTTGVYKKVLRDVSTEARGIDIYARINAMSRDALVYVADYQLWTAAGYRWPLTVWALGSTVVLQSAPDLLRPFDEHDFSHVLMTPDKLMGLLRTPGAAPRRNAAMRLMVTGGALGQELLGEAQRLLTTRVYSVLAATEASIFAVTPLVRAEDLLAHRIHPAREVQVVDAQDRPLGPGREGRLRVRITDGLAGYLGDEAATREHFRDGWFYPGDLGLLRPDGRLALHGRASDVVNVLGNKIATAPIEQALRDRLRVSAVCIVTLPEATVEDELQMVIETSRALADDEIVAAVEAEFGPLRALPVRVRFTDALPRNEMGKVLRTLLRQQLKARAD
jgi:acyl-coenzyme A synthetase/AMP-(fatty) acid ligase